MDPAFQTRILDVLKRYPSVELAIVYGSFARGAEKAGSDLDLAIAGGLPFDAEFKVSLMNDLSLALKREIDLIDLSQASGTVLKEAMCKGVVILNRDHLRYAHILTRMLLDEEDFQKGRARLMKQRRKKAFDVA